MIIDAINKDIVKVQLVLDLALLIQKPFNNWILIPVHLFLCSVRKDTVRIDWGAYPHYKAPEVFAPFILDGRHLYYMNAFENAASTMETSAVAAENVARLILSRFFDKPSVILLNLTTSSEAGEELHLEL